MKCWMTCRTLRSSSKQCCMGAVLCENVSHWCPKFLSDISCSSKTERCCPKAPIRNEVVRWMGTSPICNAIHGKDRSSSVIVLICIDSGTGSTKFMVWIRDVMPLPSGRILKYVRFRNHVFPLLLSLMSGPFWSLAFFASYFRTRTQDCKLTGLVWFPLDFRLLQELYCCKTVALLFKICPWEGDAE